MNNSHFTFQGQFDSHYNLTPNGDQSGLCSRKRKSSYEDISPLVMKTRSGIGLEEEIVYDRTITLMMQGQRRLQEEQRMQSQLQQHQHSLQQPQVEAQPTHRESSADAMKRLFMFSKSQSPTQHNQRPQNTPQVTNNGLPTFADCAGEINGCETNRIPRDLNANSVLSSVCLVKNRHVVHAVQQVMENMMWNIIAMDVTVRIAEVS
ncbi:hypothetical protein BGZ76_002221 [Entomortierella beljakovae]|nr:hypothetical protein BGZ76_002221 [Entomortierella beljakovae]